MRALGASKWEPCVLQVGYRCPAEVTALGRHVLDPASPMPGKSVRSPVCTASFDSDLHLVAWILDAVHDLAERDPKAAIALVCRSDESARRFASWVRRGTVVRLAVSGEFLFRSGLSATCVREVKGLEFDHVIVPDATAAAWPDTRESRRALYVAATRAMRQLVLACSGTASPLYAP